MAVVRSAMNELRDLVDKFVAVDLISCTNAEEYRHKICVLPVPVPSPEQQHEWMQRFDVLLATETLNVSTPSSKALLVHALRTLIRLAKSPQGSVHASVPMTEQCIERILAHPTATVNVNLRHGSSIVLLFAELAPNLGAPIGGVWLSIFERDELDLSGMYFNFADALVNYDGCLPDSFKMALIANPTFDVNTTTFDGATMLDNAVRHEKVDIVAALLRSPRMLPNRVSRHWEFPRVHVRHPVLRAMPSVTCTGATLRNKLAILRMMLAHEDTDISGVRPSSRTMHPSGMRLLLAHDTFDMHKVIAEPSVFFHGVADDPPIAPNDSSDVDDDDDNDDSSDAHVGPPAQKKAKTSKA